MHKYQLYKTVCHTDFDKTMVNNSTTITGSTRQAFTLFHEHGHLIPSYTPNAGTTPELQNTYKVFEEMARNLLASSASVFLHKQPFFEVTKQADKICKDIFLGDKAIAIS